MLTLAIAWAKKILWDQAYASQYLKVFGAMLATVLTGFIPLLPHSLYTPGASYLGVGILVVTQFIKNGSRGVAPEELTALIEKALAERLPPPPPPR